MSQTTGADVTVPPAITAAVAQATNAATDAARHAAAASTAMTQADVHAQAAAASAAEVQASQAGAAPASELMQMLQSLADRMGKIEQVIGVVAPEVNAAAAVAGVFVPGALPILARLPLIEAGIEGVLSSLSTAFGDKLGDLPPPGSVSPTVAAALVPPPAQPARMATGPRKVARLPGASWASPQRALPRPAPVKSVSASKVT